LKKSIKEGKRIMSKKFNTIIPFNKQTKKFKRTLAQLTQAETAGSAVPKLCDIVARFQAEKRDQAGAAKHYVRALKHFQFENTFGDLVVGLYLRQALESIAQQKYDLCRRSLLVFSRLRLAEKTREKTQHLWKMLDKIQGLL
jgi:hypothetical protein